MGNTKDVGLHHALNFVNGLVGAPQFPKSIAGKSFDRYDIVSFYYGWINALNARQSNLVSQNQCYLSVFETITQLDYLSSDVSTVFRSGRYFNVVVYDPVKVWNNLAAAYEYCNGYLYIAQFALLVQLNFGFLSELTTRWTIVIAE